MAENVRADVYYLGAVQGVGFRYMATKVAARFAVTGYVQNLSDGTVRIVAEGTRPEIMDFLGAVEEEMAGYIEDTRITWGAATGEFGTFRVRF